MEKHKAPASGNEILGAKGGLEGELESSDVKKEGAPKGEGGISGKWLALCAIAVFIIAFMAIGFSKQPSAYDVDGMRFESPGGIPGQELKKILQGEKITLTVERPEGDAACAYGALIQLSAGLGAANKTPQVQIKTGNSCVVSDVDVPVNCKEGGIMIRQGSCDCVKMDEKQMTIEGSAAFLCNNSVKLSDFVAYSMTGRHLDLKKANELLRKYQEQQANNKTGGTANATSGKNPPEAIANQSADNVTGDVQADEANVSDEKLNEPLVANSS